ncbi:MAG TPA: glycosyl hydrolase family 28 protein [Candidatus Methylacidiphilales bacterium]|nr:glycosyl hydrolase family 28 protein [Candidatus Methylacidiphilales bacterium]
MTTPDDPSLSRRNWLGIATTSVIAASVGAVAATEFGQKATPAPAPPNNNGLGARVYNIRDFGAKGDGKAPDTAALQAAIDACAKDQGGTVLVPAGVFLIGTVELKSNVTLHLAAGGKLLGAADGKQYHAVDAIPLRGDSTLNDGNVALIFAVKAENILIEGQGAIDGQGAQFHSPTRGAPSPAGLTGGHRPYHLLFYRCRNLTVRDVSLVSSAFHSIRVIQSSYVKMEGLHIHNRVNSNNDGFHFISCQYVHITNCDVQSQDDACALFGSCKFVTITNSSFSTRWSVFRFGGGVAENITVSNCLIYEVYGCPIKMQCGGNSRFENISFSNLIMNKVTGPISIGVGAGARRPAPAAGGAAPGAVSPALPSGTSSPVAASSAPSSSASPAPATASPTPPHHETASPAPAETAENEASTHGPSGIVRNISFNGIRATVVFPEQLPDLPFPSGYRPGEIKSCIVLNGVGDAFLENISFNDIQVMFPGGGTAEEAAATVPKINGEYFEIGTPSAYGIFARNVRGLTLSNVRLEAATPELRPAVVFDHVEDAAVNGLNAQGNNKAASLLRFTDARDILLSASRILAPVPTFLAVEGAASQAIIVDGGDLSKAATPVSFHADAPKQSVKLRT